MHTFESKFGLGDRVWRSIIDSRGDVRVFSSLIESIICDRDGIGYIVEHGSRQIMSSECFETREEADKHGQNLHKERESRMRANQLRLSVQEQIQKLNESDLRKILDTIESQRE